MTIANNYFNDAGANGIYLEAQQIQVLGNHFYRNHRTAPFQNPGGQIDLDTCADQITVRNNYFYDGPSTPNGYWVQGIEAHGTNLTLDANAIHNNSGEGMDLSGTQHVMITENNDPSGSFGITLNNRASRMDFSGISIRNLPGLRPSFDITVSGVLSATGHAYGISVTSSDPSNPYIDNITLINNCLPGNGQPLQTTGVGANAMIYNNNIAFCYGY